MKIKNLKGKVIGRVNADTLSHSILHRANLRNADLQNADLQNADLTNANLTNANLTNANLTDVDLYNANLKGVDLCGTIGNDLEIKNLDNYPYGVAYTKDIVFIGCEGHSWAEWEAFTDAEIKEMDGFRAVKLWAKYKDEILTKIKANPAVG